MRNKMWIAVAAAVVMSGGILVSMPVDAHADEIPTGIYVGEFSLGGMSLKEAEQTIREYVESVQEQKITLEIAGESIGTTAEKLGFYWSNTDAVEKIAAAYEGGNLIKQYMNRKDLEKNPVKIPFETALDEAKLSEFITEESAGLASEAKDAEITRLDGKFVVTPSVTGIAVDIPATKKRIEEALEEGLEQPVSVKAVITEEKPRIATGDLESIQDVLGTFTTDFSSSGAARSKNLKVGSGKINGHIVLKGETLSGYECMQPFTTENGYETSKAYENGMVVDSIGGGVCQIATTLYNAALLSELTITQRQNHSMAVNYVPASQDAAIAGTYKDIKITNPYDTPIYIEGYTSGKKLTFTIYGKEIRPESRTIKYVSETMSVSDPGAAKIVPDNTLAPGARVNVQSAHKGIKSRLWKYVYEDGIEKEKIILNTDTYNPSPAIIRVGPEVLETPPETEAMETPVESPPELQTEPETAGEIGPGIS